MKALLCFFLVIGNVFAQDPNAYLKTFDSKVYSLKTKGVKDFSVDIESSKLTEQINEQKIFGKVDQVIFRIFWTASPERLAIEVIGMPEGFREIKEELKANVMGLMENLIPPTLAQRFSGYKFSQGPKQREITATDSSGVAAVPSFTLKFDEKDKLTDITANKPVGTLTIEKSYEKESFSDGKWVLKEHVTKSSGNGASLIVEKELSYDKANGIGVLSEIETTTKQNYSNPEIKSSTINETITFKNYKINTGVALKHFLGESRP